MKVLICGDRDYTNKGRIKYALANLGAQTDVIIEGECIGADLLGAEIGEELGISIERYPAQWHRFGRAAGPMRNKQMLNEGKPDIVLAFHNNILKSHGTKNMIMQSLRQGVRVVLYAQDGEYQFDSLSDFYQISN